MAKKIIYSDVYPDENRVQTKPEGNICEITFSPLGIEIAIISNEKTDNNSKEREVG